MESVKNMESTPVPYIVYEGEAMIERLKDMRDETDDPTERKEFDAFIKSIERRG